MFVLIGLLAVHGKGVDILRMIDRSYGSEELEIKETGMDEVDTADFETAENKAFKSFCDPPEVDTTCGELKNKVPALGVQIIAIKNFSHAWRFNSFNYRR